MPKNESIALEDLPTDAYFAKYKPSAWQLGGFSNYCYGLPGFPYPDRTDRKKRKRAAFNLFMQALEHFSKTDDVEKKDAASKLMKGFRTQSIKIDNHITITGAGNTVNTAAGNLTQISSPATSGARLREEQGTSTGVKPSGSISPPPPPPYEQTRKATHERKRKVPQREREPSSSASPIPPPKRFRPTTTRPTLPPRISHTHSLPPQQPIRQQLLHLRETSLRDIAATNARIRPQLQQSLKLLDGLRQFTLTQLALIEQTMGEVECLSRRCAEMAEEVDKKVGALTEDPLLVGDDYMLTEKEETELEGECEGQWASEQQKEEERDRGFGSSPPPLVWMAREQGFVGIEDFF